MSRRRHRPSSRPKPPQLIGGVPAPDGPLYGALWRPDAYNHKHTSRKLPQRGDQINFHPKVSPVNPNYAFTKDLRAVVDQILGRTQEACGVVRINNLIGRPLTPVPNYLGGVKGEWWFVGGGPTVATVMEIDMRRNRRSGAENPANPSEVSPQLAQAICISSDLLRQIERGSIQHTVTTEPLGQPGEIVLLTDGKKTLPVRIIKEAEAPKSLLHFYHPDHVSPETQALSYAWTAAGLRFREKPVGLRQAVFTMVTPNIGQLSCVDRDDEAPQLQLVQ